jgi:uncharacterized membrane protein YccF (DUF307 family)
VDLKLTAKNSIFGLQFQEIQYAYSILSDESKRAIYDMHGESAARKFDEQGRNSHTVFSPNPLLARRIWIFFFGFWLLCVLLDPFIGVPLEWSDTQLQRSRLFPCARILTLFV